MLILADYAFVFLTVIWCCGRDYGFGGRVSSFEVYFLGVSVWFGSCSVALLLVVLFSFVYILVGLGVFGDCEVLGVGSTSLGLGVLAPCVNWFGLEVAGVGSAIYFSEI